MTNPALSIITTEQIGRLYQLPSGTYEKKITSKAARAGIESGELLPSITNVLNVLNKNLEGYAVFMMGKALREGATQADAAKEYITYRDHAAARGSAVHLLIEQYIDRQRSLKREAARTSYPPMFRSLPAWVDVNTYGGAGYMNAFINFCNTMKPEFLQQETTVYGCTDGSGVLNYAGTTDFIATINGRKVVGDWKCTSKLHGSVARQMAAVRNATHYFDTETGQLESWDSESLEGAIAVRLCADGSFEIKEANLQAGWNSFKLLREEWNNYAFNDADMLIDYKKED
jgi:hypothetical protein